MTFTYDPHGLIARDRVRAYTQDTDGDDPRETDEAIDALVLALGEWGAKAELCDRLAGRFARPVTVDPNPGPDGQAPVGDRSPQIALARYWSEQADKARVRDIAARADLDGGLRSSRPVRSDAGPVRGEYTREPGDWAWPR